MQAAVYGRAFCSADAFPRDRIVAVCRQLRILNTLRAPGVGLPLTAAQVGLSPHRRLLHHWAPSMHSGPGEQGAACLWWIVLLELLSQELCTWETLQYMSRNINTR